MSKVNSRERIVVGVDAVRKYAQIGQNHHNSKISICLKKDVWFHQSSGKTETDLNIWCSGCGKFYHDLPSFLKAHGIED